MFTVIPVYLYLISKVSIMEHPQWYFMKNLIIDDILCTNTNNITLMLKFNRFRDTELSKVCFGVRNLPNY